MYIVITSVLSISCIILYMVELFHIKSEKYHFATTLASISETPTPLPQTY